MKRKPFGFKQLGPDKWQVRPRDPLTGKQHSKVIYGDEAAAYAYGFQQLNPTQIKPETPKRTFLSYRQTEFAAYTRENWKNGSTQVTQNSYLDRHITPFFADMNLEDIKPLDIARFHAKMQAKGLAPATRCNLHAILSCMFSYACDLELIAKNPVKKRLAPHRVKSEKPALSDEQVVKLLADVPIKYKAYFSVLLYCGVRPGEALGLKWEDADFGSRELHIRRAIYRQREIPPKTEASLRTRPMVQPLYEALLNHRTLAHFKQPGDFVFASLRGKTPINPDVLRDVLKAALKRIGVVWKPRVHGLHLLRHSSGSLVYKHTGFDIKATQNWLAHANSRITMDIYTHLAATQEQRTAEQLAAGIFAQPEAPTIMH